MIFWNGKSSDDLNVFVEHFPSQSRATKKYSRISVPGRNGDLIFEEDSFENEIQPYEIYISAKERKLPFAARKVSEWLFSAKGYQRLVDSYDPDVFRLAFFSGPLDVENILNMFGRATIEFDCKPQRFLVSGERIIFASNGGIIENPTSFTALPIIIVRGSGEGLLNIAGTVVRLSSINDNVILDCEAQNAYKGTENLNNTISAPEFPVLFAGNNEISWSGGITNVEIIPRWWTK